MSPLRDQVLAAARQFGRRMHEMIDLLVAFDLSGDWAFESRSAAHWLAAAFDTEVCTAREWLQIGHRLGELAEIRARFAAGKLSYSKVRVLIRSATPANELDLCALAERHTAGQLRGAIAGYLARTETDHETEQRHRQNEGLRWHTDADGLVRFSATLAPARAGAVIAAIDATVMHQPHPRTRGQTMPTLAQQRADALHTIITSGIGTIDTELVIHIRGDGCTLDDGTPIPQSIVERLAPQSFLRALIVDANRRPINASGRQRHPTTRQKRVVQARHNGCIDCGSHDLTHYDHNPPYEQTHHTLIDELQPRCAPCHRHRHNNQSIT